MVFRCDNSHGRGPADGGEGAPTHRFVTSPVGAGDDPNVLGPTVGGARPVPDRKAGGGPGTAPNGRPPGDPEPMPGRVAPGSGPRRGPDGSPDGPPHDVEQLVDVGVGLAPLGGRSDAALDVVLEDEQRDRVHGGPEC